MERNRIDANDLAKTNRPLSLYGEHLCLADTKKECDSHDVADG